MTQEEYDGQEEVREAPLLPVLRFEHVRVAGYKHFLVLNGFRGSICDYSQPALHPEGWVYFPVECYSAPHSLKGKLLKIIDPASDNGMWRDVELTLTDDSTCEIAQKAFNEYMQLSKTCGEVKANRYPEACVIPASALTGGDNDIHF